ncbi:glycosyltransferase family 2 protein [Ensifer adhaerens]|uniref:glycosyltransferase family 2 protein n=1 Tax=Ensifer adhaerens TaxID=106592 RepID=UPI0023A9603F|nr:glycosyltransferase family 2 protein [Ensifer adhaerens]WDZ75669.1 glycosyltransferase family 2 protein [Ensifer adhaerens]
MTTEQAELVVVFPVYNGAKTFLKSLECIANQDFAAFRAIILENCSTDDTLSIAQAFCEKDSRFSVVRNSVHLSAQDNFTKAFELGAASGKFFCLRACDDFSSADFLGALVGALRLDEGRMLAAGSTKVIGKSTLKMKHPASSVIDFRSSYEQGKVPRNLTFPAEWIYGVFRSGARDTIVRRWVELNNPWCSASYVLAEFIARDLVVYVSGPTYDFVEGSGSEQKYGAKAFRDRLQQRLKYTFGCYKLVHILPKAGLLTRMKFFRMCWNDARRKTRYKLFWIF